MLKGHTIMAEAKKIKWHPSDIGLIFRPDVGLSWRNGVGPVVSDWGRGLRKENEDVINSILFSLGYTGVSVIESKHADFQCNMNEAKPLTYDIYCNMFGEVAILEYAKMQDEELYTLCMCKYIYDGIEII